MHVNSILSFVNKTDEKDLASFAAQVSKFQQRPRKFIKNSK